MLSKNCFSGTIPENICKAKELSSLILDALSINNECSRHMNKIHGTMPSCLWAMDKLENLQLSSNKLSGTVPNIDFNRSNSNLVNISLSYNLFSGSIPDFLISNKFQSIDLSHNKFGFTLNNKVPKSSNNMLDISSNKTSLILNINRISGDLPLDFINSYYDLNVLEGNYLF